MGGWNRATQPPSFSLLSGEIVSLPAGFVLFSTVVFLGDPEFYFFVPEVGNEAQGMMVEQVDLDAKEEDKAANEVVDNVLTSTLATTTCTNL